MYTVCRGNGPSLALCINNFSCLKINFKWNVNMKLECTLPNTLPLPSSPRTHVLVHTCICKLTQVVAWTSTISTLPCPWMTASPFTTAPLVVAAGASSLPSQRNRFWHTHSTALSYFWIPTRRRRWTNWNSSTTSTGYTGIVIIRGKGTVIFLYWCRKLMCTWRMCLVVSQL